METLRRLICLAAVFMLLPGLCRADPAFSWPAELAEIGEEAFAGNPTLSTLEIPEGVVFLGPRAFADCPELNQVFVPASVTDIGDGAFDGCGEALLILCEPDSDALDYAVSHQTDYRAGTVCRALVIGQTYAGTAFELPGPANDLRAMQFCLNEMGWNVTARSNLSVDGILSAISSTFASATPRDISLFYYSGHGEDDGSLRGSDGSETLSPSQLRTALDAVPGRKVIIVDACYSGQLIAEDRSLPQSGQLLNRSKSAGESGGAAGFVSAFQSAFSHQNLRGALSTSSYYVITAAGESEQSAENYITSGGSGKRMGYFTYAFCLGLGFNGVTFRSADLNADVNNDMAVSVREAYQWAYTEALKLNPYQHASVWPADCAWFAPFRP